MTHVCRTSTCLASSSSCPWVACPSEKWSVTSGQWSERPPVFVPCWPLTTSHWPLLLVQPFLAPQAAEAADVCQSEGKAEQVFVAHVGNRVAAILHCHTAAVPVVRGLCGDKLQQLARRVKTKTAGGAEGPLVGAAVSQGSAKLVKARGGGRT